MAEPKTRPTDASVEDFLAAIPHDGRRADARALDSMLRAATGELPVLWGASIVGYGAVDQPGSGGRTRSWPVISFSPRKSELVLYLNTAIDSSLFDQLGPHRRGVGCLYLKRLADVDDQALRQLLDRSIELARG